MASWKWDKVLESCCNYGPDAFEHLYCYSNGPFAGDISLKVTYEEALAREEDRRKRVGQLEGNWIGDVVGITTRLPRTILGGTGSIYFSQHSKDMMKRIEKEYFAAGDAWFPRHRYVASTRREKQGQ